MSKALLHSTRSTPYTAAATAPRGRSSFVVRAQRVELCRRDVTSAILTGVLTLSASSPAEAQFDLGGPAVKEYETNTSALLDTVKNVVSLSLDDPLRQDAVSKVRDSTNRWVAKYRRDNRFAGRPSFSNTYSLLNALSGHFNSFGTETPLPKKRLEILLKEVADAERFLSRGR